MLKNIKSLDSGPSSSHLIDVGSDRVPGMMKEWIDEENVRNLSHVIGTQPLLNTTLKCVMCNEM
jgi:hypothetical protein